MSNNRLHFWASLLLTFTLSPAALATNLEWQGFIAQGVVKASDSGFVNSSGNLSTELTELGINGRYSISPSLHLAGQVVYLDGGNRYTSGLRLDYLLLDWYFYNSPDWQANLYLGRYKNQHWLYSSTRDVPFTRPTIVLPQSVYFDAFRDIAVGSDGIATQVRHHNDWGDFTFNWGIGSSPVSQAQGELILGGDIAGDLKLDFDHQASIVWQPELSHFSYGLVLLDSNFSYHATPGEQYYPADFSVRRIMLSLRYQLEKWEFSSELQQERTKIDGFFAMPFQQDTIGQGAYLLAQYRQSPRLKWFAMLDYSVINKDDRRGRQLSANSGGVVPADRKSVV